MGECELVEVVVGCGARAEEATGATSLETSVGSFDTSVGTEV